MSGFVKYFEHSNKNMSFVTEDENVYLKYSKIWDRVKKLLRYSADSIRDKKYIVTKLKVFNGVNNTTFTDEKIPKERNPYACIAAIDVDSVSKVDKKVYPQAYLEQCKYKLRNRRPANFTDAEIESSDSDHYSDAESNQIS